MDQVTSTLKKTNFQLGKEEHLDLSMQLSYVNTANVKNQRQF